jgi:site-specific DNA recombinase
MRCGTCERLLESCWSNGKAAYRCRHGHTTATRPDPARPGNAYIREDQILPRLPALGILLSAPGHRSRKQDTAHPPVPVGGAAMISYLRAQGITLIYDSDEHTLRAAAPTAPYPSPPTAERRQQGDNKG